MLEYNCDCYDILLVFKKEILWIDKCVIDRLKSYVYVWLKLSYIDCWNWFCFRLGKFIYLKIIVDSCNFNNFFGFLNE